MADKKEVKTKKVAKPKVVKEAAKVSEPKVVKVVPKVKVAKPEIETKNETADFSGKYITAIGRRKTAIARIRLYEGGKGVILVNNKKINQYFPGDGANNATAALRLFGRARDLNFSIIVRGGGTTGQIEAVRHGISRAIIKLDEESQSMMRTAGYLTRDRRKKERKKPGLKKARKAPQWAKR